MTDTSDLADRAILASHIEQIAKIQSSIQEGYVEIGRVRQDARADGFNMEAAYQLGQILAKSPHDAGAGLLIDILKYAQQLGIELDNTAVEQVAKVHRPKEDKREDYSDVSNFTEKKIFLDGRLSLWIQFALGIVVSGAFIWLLR